MVNTKANVGWRCPTCHEPSEQYSCTACSWRALKVIIAARLSKLQKGGRQGIGLDTQETHSTAYCDRERMEIVAVVADTKSGTVAPWDRPNLKPWVTDLSLMVRYDAIVAFDNDRLSRGAFEDEAEIRKWAKKHNKRLIIVNGPQWPPRPNSADSILWAFMADRAHGEWEKIRERSIRDIAEIQERGFFSGGALPWGYTTEGERYNRVLLPDEIGKKYVPEIFARCIAGESCGRIAEWLEREGLGHWYASTVRGILRNPTYCGRYMDKKQTRVVYRCEPLVNARVYKQANDALTNRRRGGGVRRRPERSMLIPLCPCCDWAVDTKMPASPMYRAPVGDKYAYYRCAGHGKKRQSCGNFVNLATTERLVDQVLSQLDSPIYETVIIPGTNHEAEIEEINRDLRDLPGLNLPENEEDEQRATLRAEKKRLMALTPTPDRVELVDTGETYGDMWQGLADHERRDWVAARGIKVYAAQTKRGVVEAAYPQLRLNAMGAATMVEGDGVSVVVTWAGAGIDHAEQAA